MNQKEKLEQDARKMFLKGEASLEELQTMLKDIENFD